MWITFLKNCIANLAKLAQTVIANQEQGGARREKREHEGMKGQKHKEAIIQCIVYYKLEAVSRHIFNIIVCHLYAQTS